MGVLPKRMGWFGVDAGECGTCHMCSMKVSSMDAITIKLILMFIGAFILGFVLGYQYALNEQGGLVE